MKKDIVVIAEHSGDHVNSVTFEVVEFAKTLPSTEAQSFIDRMIELGIVRDWSDF